jgi:short-subunit dehydrogenase
MTTTPSRSQTVLITGASAGIGLALAHRFARAGFQLVLVARSADKLKAVAKALSEEHGVRSWVIAADLSQPEAAARLAAAMKRSRRTIDVLVNCAGVLQHGPFSETPAARHQQMIDLNVSGLTAMLAHFLPGMLERGQGRVLNVASIAAFQPVPLLATYAATKAYVLSLTESMSEELKGSGVSITALCPGITATAMLENAKVDSQELNKLPGFLIGSADAVADAGFEACMRGDVICVPGAINLAGTMASRATPRWLLRQVSGALVRRML